MFGKSPSGISGAEQKSHYRPETMGRCQAHEIKSRDGRFEVLGKHGRVFDRPECGLDLLAEEHQPAKVDPVAGCCDHVVGLQFTLSAPAIEVQANPSPSHLSEFWCMR